MQMVVLNGEVNDAKIRKAARRFGERGSDGRKNELRTQRAKPAANYDMQRMPIRMGLTRTVTHIATAFVGWTPGALTKTTASRSFPRICTNFLHARKLELELTRPPAPDSSLSHRE